MWRAISCALPASRCWPRAWARADAVVALAAASGDEFHVAKRDTVRHCFDYVLPEFSHAPAMVRVGWNPLAFLPVVAASSR